MFRHKRRVVFSWQTSQNMTIVLNLKNKVEHAILPKHVKSKEDKFCI